MNNILKTITLTIVLTIGLCFLLYSLSCYIASCLGLFTFTPPIVIIIVILTIVIVRAICKGRAAFNPVLVAFFSSLFISALVTCIMLSTKFDSNEFYAKECAVITKSGNEYGDSYLYNKWGYKIIQDCGTVEYDNNRFYLMSRYGVYVIDCDGNYIEYSDYASESYKHDDYKFVEHPFNKKYYYCDRYGIKSKNYEDIKEISLKDRDKNRYFCCYVGNEMTDIIGAGGFLKDNCIYHGYYHSNDYLCAIKVQESSGKEYEIINLEDFQIETRIYDWQNDYKQCNYVYDHNYYNHDIFGDDDIF